jgi:hypothetical protein
MQVVSQQDQVVSQQDHLGGLAAGPPTYQDEGEDTRARASIDSINLDRSRSIEQQPPDMIDRILSAKPSDHDPQDLQAVKRIMAGYQAKFPPTGWDGKASPNASYPDDQPAAQILAMVSLPQFQRLIGTLMTKRVTPGYEWPWFVSVVAQRCCNIPPATLKMRRAGLHVTRTRRQPIRGKQEPLIPQEPTETPAAETKAIETTIAGMAERARTQANEFAETEDERRERQWREKSKNWKAGPL